MRRRYEILLMISVAAIALSAMFLGVRRGGSLLYDLAYALVFVPLTDISFPFKWVLIPALLVGGWSAVRLMSGPGSDTPPLPRRGWDPDGRSG